MKLASFILALLLTAAPVAAVIPGPELECLRDAELKSIDDTSAAYDHYFSGYLRAYDDYRDDVDEAFDISDEKQRRQALSTAKKNFLSALRSAKQTLQTTLRNVKKAFKDEKKRCQKLCDNNACIE